MLEFVTTELENPVNLWIIITIVVLALIDLFSKKNFKSQIVSLGVLGTFIGIFIGLQNFDPADMKNSINSILLGLKTAFLTSIVGMLVSIFLAIIEKFKGIKKTSNSEQENILLKILEKLDALDNSQNTDKMIGELERLRTVQTDTRDETKKIPIIINKFQQESSDKMNSLVEILDENFKKMNTSLEKAIEQLSKGATEEIIKALETVIKDFNQELQSSFGDNFVKLNEAVINLLEWQNNYKTHIETLDKKLDLSTTSIEKSKESLEIISSKNKDIIKIYQALAEMINKSKTQINTLNEELETYGHLSENAKNMFSTIEETIKTTETEFKSLTETIKVSNTEQQASHNNLTEHIKGENTKQVQNTIESCESMSNQVSASYKDLTEAISVSNNEQKESFKRDNEEIKKSHKDLTQHIKEESKKQIEYNENIFEALKKNFEKNKKELDIISQHFKNLGIEIPKSLDISLSELNRGLTSLTTEFQKNYKETLEKYNRGLNNGRG